MTELMDIKRRLREVVQLDRLSNMCVRDVRQLYLDSLAAIERLEAGPCHEVCVHPPVGGYPHESDCVGCRVEKTCFRCGHFVDMLSKHR
jgi:hypothetical protein